MMKFNEFMVELNQEVEAFRVHYITNLATNPERYSDDMIVEDWWDQWLGWMQWNHLVEG